MVTLPPMPEFIARLPRDERGYPVPWFVTWLDGKPEFRVADGYKLRQAVKHRLCWVCGGDLDPKRFTFVIGPMCVVNQTTAEPPCHPDCAEFAAKACPFLNNPNSKRREANLPAESVDPPGCAIRRNPGVTALWTCSRYESFNAGNGSLIHIGPPAAVTWWKLGRRALRHEVIEAIESGLPTLQEMAVQDSPEAVAALSRMVRAAMLLIPSRGPNGDITINQGVSNQHAGG